MSRRLATALLALGLTACPEPSDDTDRLSLGLTEGCLLAECHAKVEQIHYGGPPLRCVDCHLGDPNSITKEGAHVTIDVSFNETTPGATYLDKPPLHTLDELPDEVIRFLNPADYRVAEAACGSAGLGGANCHPDIVSSSLLMNRATLSGQLTGGGFLAGIQGKEAIYGVVDATDPHTPSVLGPQHVGSLVQLPSEVPDDVTDPVARAFFPAYEQLCLECHLYQDGTKSPGLYYSSGCNGCHIVSDDDARAKTLDITQDVDELGHISTHRFTNQIPDRQCAHCHISHLSRSLLAQGIRERSEHEGDAAYGGPNRGVEDPEEVVPWPEDKYVRYKGGYWIYGKPYPFYLEDEDGTNDVDETPPDVHTAKGMGCIDCHNIRESHGDPTMSIRMDSELDVRCSSCHGRPGELGSLRSDAGLVFNRAETAVGEEGTNKPVFEIAEDGEVLQHVRFTGALHSVTQITERTDASSATFNPRTQMGCALHAGDADTKRALKVAVNDLAGSDPTSVDEVFPGLVEGFTFDVSGAEPDGRVECFTCHNSWTVNCYGCHMIRDDREEYRSQLTGEMKKGKVNTFGMSVLADSLAMGFNAQGKITPMIGTSIFFSHIDETGDTLIDAVPLEDGHGVAGEGNVHNPAHHHTTQQKPRDCDGCHPSATDSHDEDALKTAVGLGSGRFTFIDGTDRVHLLDRQVFADYDGDGVDDDPAANPLPTDLARVTPVASTTHAPIAGEPGPLDLETIERILQSPVLPQRPEETR